MRAAIILNPNAGSAHQARALIERIHADPTLQLMETRAPGDAAAFADRAAGQAIHRILSAGGDGTTHETVQGLDGHFDHVTLGIIPLGTGNDLPRTLALPTDPLAALDLALNGEARAIDLIRVGGTNGAVWCVNVSAGGFSGQMHEILTDELKATWGPLAYVRGALGALPDLTQYHTEVSYDGQPPRGERILNLIVANARFAAGGFVVAPRANPEDGLMDVVAVHGAAPAELAGVAARLIAGDYSTSPVVSVRRVTELRVDSTPGMWFNVDGELMGNEPMTFTLHPKKLGVVVGETYRAEGGST